MTETINIQITETGRTDTITINQAARGPQGPPGPDGLPDAPIDGAQYVRKDGAWEGLQGRNGFIDYNNTDNPTAITADTWTTIPNDGLGAFTNKTYKPDGVTELMDTSDGSIDVSELDLGDTILIRNDFSVNPNTNNALLEFRYQLGTGGGAYTLETVIGRLDDGSGKYYRFALKPDLIYMGDTNSKDNPISLQIRLSTSGSLINAGSAIQVIRR